ncbi:adenine DNA glycosylase isoform X2 [Syngnathoides biaculeatus]|uniref:adenine DNA glycosylase isoform X2 n=1 Tax=Syngnathoides biaculeatus TaxID=300417 RepID=UPI002ADE1345|nr:adenine DNA glycosylase isoform X2 [Syngnathoides biaculeatus]
MWLSCGLPSPFFFLLVSLSQGASCHADDPPPPHLPLPPLRRVYSLRQRATTFERFGKEASKKGSKKEPSVGTSLPPYHNFREPADVGRLRTRLLSWYDLEKRELPWRTLAQIETDVNIRTYAVWVSEVMLQQTQVATVIDYYKKWLKRWPTVADLAAATLEEVNQMWAGLGYYSRGKRLHEGARKVVSELGGRMPDTADELLRRLPGVTGAVDGNVIRVLCRMRAVGADCTSPAVTEALWALANTLVDPGRPGDFNQAMMELGARVCTPKGPLCQQCPVRSHCHSYLKVHARQEQNSRKFLGSKGTKPPALPDIEECGASGTCRLCPTEPWDEELGVQNFPRKPAKKPPRVERTLTCVPTRRGGDGEDEFLLVKGPNKGLLAGLWEFPSVPLAEVDDSEKKQQAALCAHLGNILGAPLTGNPLQYAGEVLHVFSHIRRTYVVHTLRLGGGDEARPRPANVRWIGRSALREAAVSAAVKKTVKLCDSAGLRNQQSSPVSAASIPGIIRPTSGIFKTRREEKGRRRQEEAEAAPSSGSKTQTSLRSFFGTPKREPC